MANPSNIHEQNINAFLKKNPQWKRYGLRKELNNQLGAYDHLPPLGIIPDAFCISVPHFPLLQILEVETSQPISEYKMNVYRTLWWDLSCLSWSLELTLINTITGLQSVITDDDFCELYYKKLWQRRAVPTCETLS
jgi:hypothetical protein